MNEEHDEQDYPSRWQLVRDVVAFQFKLAMDGLRDILLSPVSIGAAIIGIFSDRNNPGIHFYRLLEWGHKTDRWINLFGSHTLDKDEPSADELLRKAEQAVVDQYSRGGVVSQIKDQADKAIDAVHDQHHNN